MRHTLRLLLALSLLSAGTSFSFAADAPKASAAPVAVAELERAAPADPLVGAQPPNYLRALAVQTKAAPQFAQLVRTVHYGGTLPPETKMGVALRVAQQLNSPYTAAHASRWLRASERGREMLSRVRDGRLEKLSPAEQLALSYADSLTHGVHDVSDEDFARLRAHYNDAQ